MKRYIATAVIILVATPAVSADRASCFVKCPEGSSHKNTIIERNHYTLSNNPETKFADWVAYKVTKTTTGSGATRNWAQDPGLRASDTLHPDDYVGAPAALRIDRGHQAPLASLAGLANWQVLNYLSNITPQSTPLNQGPWKALEQAERNLARSGSVSAVYVITGPLYEKEMRPMPHSSRPHVVPSGYWKVLAAEDDDTLKTAAFILHQDAKRADDYCNALVTIGDVEERSGLKLFPSLSAKERKALAERPGALVGSAGCEFIDEVASVKKVKSRVSRQ